MSDFKDKKTKKNESKILEFKTKSLKEQKIETNQDIWNKMDCYAKELVEAFDEKTNRVSASVKALTEDPYESIEKKYNVGVQVGSLRSGEAVGSFALESAVDELAHQMGMDPIELRLRNDPEVHPLSGIPFSQRALAESIERARKAAPRGGHPSPSRSPSAPL